VEQRSSDDGRDHSAPTAGPATERFLIYSQDGLGLGHLKRTTSIANEILRVRPRACVLTLSDSPLGGFFQSRPNHDYVKLPSIVKIGPGNWRPLDLSLELDEVLSMRRDLIHNAALHFRPHVLLVDHMPHGALGELVPTLEEFVSGGQTKIVLGLRDVLDSPKVIRERWRVEGAYEALRNFYDLVLIYGSRSLFDHAARYGLPAEIASKLRYCGYVCTPQKPRYASSIRTEYKKRGNASSKLIMGMAGGGADGYPIMRSLLDAVPLLEASGLRFRLVIVTGPFMPEAQRQELQARAVGLPVSVRKTVSDPFSYITAADVVVAMAGYNSTMEILRSGTPSILVPRVGPSREQRMRVKILHSRGWIDSIDPTRISGPKLAEAIKRTLDRGRSKDASGGPELNGLHEAVAHLLALLPPGTSEPRLASSTPY
jgi:predicted glycosyltransferase